MSSSVENVEIPENPHEEIRQADNYLDSFKIDLLKYSCFPFN